MTNELKGRVNYSVNGNIAILEGVYARYINGNDFLETGQIR